MKKYKKILIILIIVIIIILAIILGKKMFYRGEFELNTADKYLVTTNSRFLTMQNDGGTHINIYYQVYLDEKIVYKCEDYYKGFEGYKYKGKVLNKNKLTDNEVISLKQLFNDIISSEVQAENQTLNLNFLEISTMDYNDIKIYDEDIMNKLKNLLE